MGKLAKKKKKKKGKDVKKKNERFYLLLENLFRELDQDALKLEVEGLKQRKPDATQLELVALLTRRAAIKTAFTGASAGAPGGIIGILAMGPDIYNLVRQQSRLILAIAFIYEQEPNLDERIREVVATLAVSTGAAAGRRGIRYLISRGVSGKTFESLIRKIAGKYAARKLPAAIGPIVGGAAGAAINYASVRSISKLATAYYKELSEMQATATPPALEGTAELPESKIVDTTATKKSSSSDSKTKTSTRKSSSTKSSRKTAGKKESSRKSTSRKKSTDSKAGGSASKKASSKKATKKTSAKKASRKSSSDGKKKESS